MKRPFLFLFTSLIALSATAAPLGVGIPLNFLNSPTVTSPLPTKDVRVITYEGTRVKKTVTPPSGPAVTTIYLGDIEEITSGQVTDHIFAGGQRIAAKTGATVLYFHQDHLGSTNLVSNSAGAVVQTTKYLPFGTTWSTSGSLTDINFTGHRLDASDGLIYMKARYYDPAMGRFVTPDTIVQSPYDPQTLNRYAYARNNPVLYTDPSGYSFSLNRTVNGIGKELKRINQQMYRQWHRWNDQLDNLQDKNPNFNFSGGYGVSLGGPDSDSFTGEITYHPYNRPATNNPVKTLLVDVAKEISKNTYSRPGAGMLAGAGEGETRSRPEEWALSVAKWSESTSYVANGVAIGSLLFGPEAAPVYGGASVVAMGLDTLAGVSYLSHGFLSHQQGSFFKAGSSFLSIPLDSAPMFKPGIGVSRLGGAVSYMEKFGSRSGYVAQWYGTLRIAVSGVMKIGIQETAGYFADHFPGEKKK